MARRPMAPEESARREIAAFSGDPNAKRSRSAWNQNEAANELDEMIRSDVWENAKPKHFIELFLRMHVNVYGVEAVEARPAKVRLAAASMAARLQKQFFDNDPRKMVEFVRWVWRRQAMDEQKRRAGDLDNDFRITWRYQWSPKLVTSYRRAALLGGQR